MMTLSHPGESGQVRWGAGELAGHTPQHVHSQSLSSGWAARYPSFPDTQTWACLPRPPFSWLV